jgi:hypothetical protein
MVDACQLPRFSFRKETRGEEVPALSYTHGRNKKNRISGISRKTRTTDYSEARRKAQVPKILLYCIYLPLPIMHIFD